MTIVTRRSALRGSVTIPGSKSHTIRAVAVAGLADGVSRILSPLDSADARAAEAAYRALGATIETSADEWKVSGVAGRPTAPAGPIDVGNSGTTLRLAMGAAALLAEGEAVLTGDEQIRRRPSAPLARSLNDLGADVVALEGTQAAPFRVRGRLRGGETSIEAVTSQYLSSLLVAVPLADGDSIIRVPVLNEAPYVDMTLAWLDAEGIRYERDGYREFRVPGGQTYPAFERRIPGDFSSATFFLGAGALGSNDVTAVGLDMSDTQGDKAVVDYLEAMGAKVEVTEAGVRVRPGDLKGAEIDLNATPDALPMMAVVGAAARGTTRLVNVPQARMKESDRISAMAAELGRMGIETKELPDGLIVHGGRLEGAAVEGYGDHRIVMALAVAGTIADGETRVTTAESVAVTFPDFAELLAGLGGEVTTVADG